MITLVDKQNIPELKQFSITMMWAFPAVFMGLLPWLFSHSIHWWPLSVTVLFACLYVFYPAGIYYPYRVWMFIAGILGWINTRLILGFAFYVLIFPIGLLMRSLGKLQYRAQAKPDKSSFWIHRPDKITKNNLEDPF